MLGKARQAGAVLETREAQLVERDRGKPGQGHLQGTMIEDGEPSSVRPNRMKSTGIPKSRTGSGAMAISAFLISGQ